MSSSLHVVAAAAAVCLLFGNLMYQGAMVVSQLGDLSIVHGLMSAL